MFIDFSKLNNLQYTLVILSTGKVKSFWLSSTLFSVTCRNRNTTHCSFPSVIPISFFSHFSRKMSLDHLLITMMLSTTLILKRKLWKQKIGLKCQLLKPSLVTECTLCIVINFLHFSIREENLLKISRRVKEYKVEILNPPREGKKLLVLDVDYTLFGEILCNLWGLRGQFT